MLLTVSEASVASLSYSLEKEGENLFLSKYV
jgi:hypothetical protein